MNNLSIITIAPRSKSEIETWVQGAKEELLSGNYNPLEIAIYQKAFFTALEDLFKSDEIKKMLMIEARKFPEKTISFQGAKITKSSKKTWHYEKCNDSEYNNLCVIIEELTERKKEKEKLLQALKSEMANTETGEVINPAYFEESEYLTINLEK